MQYVTGYLAFGVPCELNSCGIWNIPKADWINPQKIITRESSETLLKDYGIEQTKLLPYNNVCVFNVANHVRAYLDMLLDLDFDRLTGLFDEAIRSIKCRSEIFKMAYGRMRDTDKFVLISSFLENEFGTVWTSYLETVEKTGEHMAKRAAELQSILEKQGVIPNGGSVSAR